MDTAIILAAGYGTRMRSKLPKAMHRIAGFPMLWHLLRACGGVFDHVVVVVGPEMEILAREAAPATVVVQHDRLGTAHAALQAERHFGEGRVAVLYADNPLITPETLRRLTASAADLALLAMRPPDPGRYGRVIARDGQVLRIVEWADATPEERAIDLCNAGVFLAAAPALRGWLAAIGRDNARGEYYLTDAVSIACGAGARVAAIEAPFDELRGINSRHELAEAEAVMQTRLRHAALAHGATLIAPDTVFFAADTVLAEDVVVEPHVVFGPGVSVAQGATLRAFSHLEGVAVGVHAVVGPYARLRPGSVLGTGSHVGNFVELKAASLGDGAKVNHLSYLGDATVGAGSNIGAGTITCNYDGFVKSPTVIGENCFVGSDSVLVAPLSVGDRALIAAGSVITRDVAADAMAFGRARQEDKPGGAAAFRARGAKR